MPDKIIVSTANNGVGKVTRKAIAPLNNIAALAADASAATIVTAFNTLIADLKAKGLMTADV